MREFPVCVVVVVPACVDERGMFAGDDDIDCRKAIAEHLGGPGSDISNAFAQRPDVYLPVSLAEKPHGAASRAEIGGSDLEHRGLAGTVRPEHHPPFVVVDMPVHVGEQHLTVPHNRHALNCEDLRTIDRS